MKKIRHKICKNCKKDFIFKPRSKREFEVRQFCSFSCNGFYYRKFSRERMTGKNNPGYGKHPWNYKGGTITLSGNRKIKYLDISGKKVHRMVMEKNLGRKLTKDEVIHHLDGNGLNNNLSNLVLLTKSEHSIIHKMEKNFKGGGVK